MEPFSQQFQVIWADLDPNSHMRHSAFNDYAAQVRISLFDHLGMPVHRLVALGYGPILFQEITTFKKEVLMSEQIVVDCVALGFRKDLKIWKLRQRVLKMSGEEACNIIITGAFMDLQKRKVAIPPKEIIDLMGRIPKAEDFSWMEKEEG